MIRIDFNLLAGGLDLDNYFISSTLEQVSKSSCCSCLKMCCASGSFKRLDIARNIAANLNHRGNDLAFMPSADLNALFQNVRIITDKFAKQRDPARNAEDSNIEKILTEALGRLTAILHNKVPPVSTNPRSSPPEPSRAASPTPKTSKLGSSAKVHPSVE